MPKKKKEVKRIRLDAPNEQAIKLKERVAELERREMARDKDFKPPQSK